MVRARKYVVKKLFDGLPKRDDYEIVEFEVPPLKNGEILIKAELISIDPYLRFFNRNIPIPYDQFGYQLGVVEDSKDPRYPIGTRMVTHKGWTTHSIANATESKTSLNAVYKCPDLKGLPFSVALGAVGMPGVTAYFGLLEVCKPNAGETVVVSAAAGAIGSIVGQIAKIKGCRVIGFAGTDDKCDWLVKELGFDSAFNYKTVDIINALQTAAPNGVDCYFDNVGGEISSEIISQMNPFGRIAVCGSISAYNDDPKNLPRASMIQGHLVGKQLTLEGFMVAHWFPRWPEAFADLGKWVKSGQIKTKDHISEGFDNIFDAFVGLFSGENTGKSVVKV